MYLVFNDERCSEGDCVPRFLMMREVVRGNSCVVATGLNNYYIACHLNLVYLVSLSFLPTFSTSYWCRYPSLHILFVYFQLI